MNKIYHYCLLLVLLSITSACTTVEKGLYPANPEATDNRTIYLIYSKNHTGIVVDINDAPERFAQLRAAFPDNHYLKFNWGDRNWYGGGSRNPITSTFALVVPTKTALRIVSVPNDINQFLDNIPRKFSEINLSNEGFDKMAKYFEDSFELTRDGKIQQLKTGTYEKRRYYAYKAKGRYHLMTNSNSWVSTALGKAGVNLKTVNLFVGDITP